MLSQSQTGVVDLGLDDDGAQVAGLHAQRSHCEHLRYGVTG